jgi:uncharacterized membrane protein YgdD (TMEM256/DUF423 family)
VTSFSPRLCLCLGAILAGLAVAAGAFAAHGLDGHFRRKYAGQDYHKQLALSDGEALVVTTPLADKFLADFKTGAEYQMYHALALLAIGVLAETWPTRSLTIAAVAFLLGIIGFSGGLYAYTLFNAKWVGMLIVPIGGTLFLVGWGALAWAVCPWRREPKGDLAQTGTGSAAHRL